MRKAIRAAAVLAAGLAMLSTAGAPAWAAQPAQHFVEDVTGDTIACGSTTYTVTSGSIKLTMHEGQSKSGNVNVTGTITPQNVVAEDTAGNDYTLRGAFWFGGTISQQGTEQFWSTAKLQIVDQGGGTVDSVNTTFFIQVVDGEVTNIKDFDFGTCEAPE